MARVAFLSVAQIERVLERVRANVAELRRRQGILQRADVRPGREPSLDGLAAELYWLRRHLELYARQVAAIAKPEPLESQTVARAGDVLAVTAEMMELLVWFGAELPADARTEPEASLAAG